MENAITHPPRTKVFIVDDSAMIRERLTDMLAENGNVDIVGEAECAADAADGITATSPDLVILDMQLRGSTGLDVLRRIHPVSPEIVFVVITNHPSPQYRKACLQAGASYFLDKSAEIATVPRVVAALEKICH